MVIQDESKIIWNLAWGWHLGVQERLAMRTNREARHTVEKEAAPGRAEGRAAVWENPESQGPEQGIRVSVWDTERRLVELEQGERGGWDRRWVSWKPGGPQCAEPWKAKQRHGFCSKENGNKLMLPDTAHGLTAGNNFPFLGYSTQSTSKAAIFFMILVAWIFWSPDLQRGRRWVASSRQHLKTTKCLPC